MRHLDKSKTPILKDVIVIRGKKEGIELDLALWWNDSYHETMLCFTNNIPQRDGGTHLTGLRAAMTRVICSAFCCMAAWAVGASVCTPKVMVAMSGAALTSP